MSATMAVAQGQEKKWDGETFDAKLTVRRWDKQGKQFIKEQGDVPAFKGENKDGEVMFWVKSVGTTNSMPLVDSELTDDKGTVWVVTKSTKLGGNVPAYSCVVEKKKP
ncbi:unnamed protein product [Gemmata massiliana]|uniref:Uncharacterized protein n=1 Tax=Gemmata massiliana TaxID=1210884 RepID=A0A6P2DC60_9BACT|nr:hypothetical protein [Gemmata massiliana]VTR97945.1 unnamed protein product [Gemmata massiliana]